MARSDDETKDKTYSAKNTPSTVESQSAKNFEYSCKDCEFKSFSRRKFFVHRKVHPQVKRCYDCILCPYKAKDRFLLEKHTLIHGEANYQCEMCSFKTKTPAGLKVHVKVKHEKEKKYHCDKCGYQTQSKSCLESHKKAKHGDSVAEHACEYCNFKTYYFHSLKVHKLSHSTIKPFCCELCGYTSATKQNLNTHMKIHTNEKPFACDMCPFQTKHINSLKEHKRSHGGVKPFACDICDYRCISKSRLRMHQKIHNKKKNGEKKPKGRWKGRNKEIITDVDTFTRITSDKKVLIDDFTFNSFWNTENEHLIYDKDKNVKEEKLSDHSSVASDNQQGIPSSPSVACIALEEKEKDIFPAIAGTAPEAERIPTPFSVPLDVKIDEGEEDIIIKQEDKSDAGLDTSPFNEYLDVITDEEKVVQSEPEDSRFSCDQCSNSYKRIDGLRNHIVSAHTKIKFPDTQKANIQDDTSMCDKGIDAKVKEKKYEKVVVKSEPEDRRFFCKQCGDSYKRNDALREHIVSVHTETKFPCDQCSYKGSTPQRLMQHQVVHKDSKLYGCDQCNYKAVSIKYLNQHLKIHTKLKQICDQCNFKTTNLRSLQRHKLRRHTGIKKHSCEECDYIGLEKNDLTRHIKNIHRDDKQFMCDHCNYVTKTKIDLKLHQSSHTFACDICSYKCTAKKILNKHKKIHSGVKQFSCEQCDYKATLKVYLKRHERTHKKLDKIYCCDVCDFTVNQATQYNKHMAAHKHLKNSSTESKKLTSQEKKHLE